MIEINNLEMSYGTKKLFSNFNITIENSSIVVITGISGSGKSTLLSIIGGLIAPDKGDIKYDGKKLKLTEKKLRHEISFLFQNFGLVEESTVKENFLFLYKKNKEQKMIEALNQVGLSSAFLYKKISSLSGGEQQRVAIAKVILKDAKVIFLDEPTSNLDTTNSHNIIDIITTLKKDKIIIISTHDLDFLNCADNIINLDTI